MFEIKTIKFSNMVAQVRVPLTENGRNGSPGLCARQINVPRKREEEREKESAKTYLMAANHVRVRKTKQKLV